MGIIEAIVFAISLGVAIVTTGYSLQELTNHYIDAQTFIRKSGILIITSIVITVCIMLIAWSFNNKETKDAEEENTE